MTDPFSIQLNGREGGYVKLIVAYYMGSIIELSQSLLEAP